MHVQQLQTPISAIVFDCDGTLSAIEGVDELAKHNGVEAIVQSLTATAMSQSGLTPLLYQKRLDLIKPKQAQLIALGQQYFQHRVLHAEEVIQVLHRLHKSVYLVSAGMNPAVTIFGELLQIPRQHIFAVDMSFDQQGNFLAYDEHSPLIHNHGKRIVLSRIKNQHEHIIHVGDGLNDLVTCDLVDRFIGYGGVFYRENIAKQCQYYIQTHSLAPLLAFILTQSEYAQLSQAEQRLYSAQI